MEYQDYARTSVIDIVECLIRAFEKVKQDFPFGDTTSEAAYAFSSVSDKIDDYFSRCSLAVFDKRAEQLFCNSQVLPP